MSNTLKNQLYKKYEQEIEGVCRYVAQHFYVPGLDKDDIKQEIRIICYENVARYDPAKHDCPYFFFHLIGKRKGINLRLRAIME